MRVGSFLDITPQLWLGCHLPVVLPCLERIHIITQEVVMMPLRKMPDTRLHSTFLLFNGVKSTYLSRYHESTQDSVLETDLLLLSSHLLLTAKYSGDKTVKVSKRLNNIKKISCLVYSHLIPIFASITTLPFLSDLFPLFCKNSCDYIRSTWII